MMWPKIVLPNLFGGPGYKEISREDGEKFLLESGWTRHKAVVAMQLWEDPHQPDSYLFLEEAIRKQHEREEAVREVMES